MSPYLGGSSLLSIALHNLKVRKKLKKIVSESEDTRYANAFPNFFNTIHPPFQADNVLVGGHLQVCFVHFSGGRK